MMTRFAIHICLLLEFSSYWSSSVLGSASNTTESPVPRLLTDAHAHDGSAITTHRLPGYCMGRGIWRFPPRSLAALADRPDPLMSAVSHAASLRKSSVPSSVGEKDPERIVFGNGQRPPSPNACPFVQRNFQCTSQHENETVGRLVYQPPDQCPIHTFESLRIGQHGSCLAGKRLAFIGDSLIRQIVAAITCAVGNYSAIGETKSLKFQPNKKEVRWASMEYFFENGMNITMRYIGSFFGTNTLPLHQSSNPSDIWQYADQTADILVLNFAVYHTRLLTPPHSAASLRAKILSYGPEIRKHAKGRVVIMGAPAKHVGVCARVPGTATSKTSRTSIGGGTNQDTPVIDELVRRQNEYLAELAALNGFDFLNVFPLTVHRSDAHVSPTDCTHYCSRGVYVVMREWFTGTMVGGSRCVMLAQSK